MNTKNIILGAFLALTQQFVVCDYSTDDFSLSSSSYESETPGTSTGTYFGMNSFISALATNTALNLNPLSSSSFHTFKPGNIEQDTTYYDG